MSGKSRWDDVNVMYPSRRIIDPATAKNVYAYLTSLVVPRPIAWVSSRSVDGVDNLAPHSFFTVVSTDPPVIAFASMGEKDTLRNIRATGEFVVCGAPARIDDLVNETAIEFTGDVSEFDSVGLTREESSVVSPSRVAEAPYAMECRLVEIKPVGNGFIVLGEVMMIAIDENVMDDHRVNATRMDLTARLDGNNWVSGGDVRSIKRLTVDEFDARTR